MALHLLDSEFHRQETPPGRTFSTSDSSSPIFCHLASQHSSPDPRACVLGRPRGQNSWFSLKAKVSFLKFWFGVPDLKYKTSSGVRACFCSRHITLVWRRNAQPLVCSVFPLLLGVPNPKILFEQRC